MELLSILMEPTRKENKKQKRLKEGQCLNMDGKLFKTYQQRKGIFKRHD
jgi:hypothetical protein